MTKNELNTAFDRMTPNDTQKERILNTILNKEHPIAKVSKLKKVHRKIWFSTAAACLVFVFTIIFVFQFSGGIETYALSITMPDGSTVLMENRSNNRSNDLAASASYVDNGPQLRFFINGKDIAKIEISSENEYIKATDWTETLDERYWNAELYYNEIEIDGTVYQYVPAKSQYDKSIVLIFPESFEEYDKIWYDWYGWNLHDWAIENDFAHIQGYNGMSVLDAEKLLESASEEEKLAIAASGGGTSSAGHILLDGYQEDKLNDRVTITITDRQGNTFTKMLIISISNNVLGQTVVTASLTD